MVDTVKQWGWAINASGLGLYLLGLAFLAGASIVDDWSRADHQRMAILGESDQAVEQGHTGPVQGETIAPAEQDSNSIPCPTDFRATDEPLGEKEVSAAEEARYEKSCAASRAWC